MSVDFRSYDAFRIFSSFFCLKFDEGASGCDFLFFLSFFFSFFF